MAYDVPVHDSRFGKTYRCPDCTDYVRYSRIAPSDQKQTLETLRGGGMIRTLRAYGYAVQNDPVGFATVWGEYGTGKTAWLQAVVLDLCRRGVSARYYHAVDVQRLIFEDMDNGTNNFVLLRRLPALAIDELDKYHWNGRSDFLKAQMQELIDSRYQNRETHLTLFALNGEPVEPTVPGDVASRLQDRRFERAWPDYGDPEPGMRYMPPVLHLQGLGDMRPMLSR